MLDRTDLDLYGEVVVLELVERLRPTLRFDSVDELVVRMHEDVDARPRGPGAAASARRPGRSGADAGWSAARW